MPSVSQENLRRLAARSIRVLQRHKDAEPAIGAFVGSLDVEAQEFIDAYDLVHTSAAKRRERRSSGVEETEKLVKKLRMWLAHVHKDVPSFDRSTYLLRHAVTDDVVADAERLLAVVEDHRQSGGEIPWADAFTADIEQAMADTRSYYAQHNDSRASLTDALADARHKAESFYEELVAFRRTLRVLHGGSHPDLRLLRNPSTRSTSDDGESDTIEDEAATAARLALTDVTDRERDRPSATADAHDTPPPEDELTAAS